MMMMMMMTALRSFLLLAGLLWSRPVTTQVVVSQAFRTINSYPTTSINSIVAVSSRQYLISSNDQTLLVDRSLAGNYTVLQTYAGHTSSVTKSISVGAYVYSTSLDGTLIQYDAASTSIISTVNGSFPMNDVSANVTGALYVAVGNASDATTVGVVIAYLSNSTSLQWICPISANPIRVVLADQGTGDAWIGGGDKNVYRLSASSGSILTRLSNHTQAVSALFQNSTHIWSGSDDMTVLLWSKSGGAPLARYTGMLSPVTGIYASSQAVYITTKGGDLYIYSIDGTMTVLDVRRSSNGTANCLGVNLGGNLLMVGTSAGDIVELAFSSRSTVTSPIMTSSSSQMASTSPVSSTTMSSFSSRTSLTSSAATGTTTSAISASTILPDNTNNATKTSGGTSLTVPLAAAGGAVGLLICSGSIFFFLRRRQQRKDAAMRKQSQASMFASMRLASLVDATTMSMLQSISPTSIVVDRTIMPTLQSFTFSTAATQPTNMSHATMATLFGATAQTSAINGATMATNLTATAQTSVARGATTVTNIAKESET